MAGGGGQPQGCRSGYELHVRAMVHDLLACDGIITRESVEGVEGSFRILVVLFETVWLQTNGNISKENIITGFLWVCNEDEVYI